MQRRVLIVDDEPSFTSMVKLVLDQKGGYDVREANDATQAVDAAKEFKPHVVLLDVMMPGMDGGDVAAQLHRDPETRQIPVVFVTALVGEDEVPVGGLVRNGYRYLPKSASFEDLTRCIDESTDGLTGG